LVEQFPMHVVTRWLGNTPAVATKHYLQVTDEHYANALACERQYSMEKVAQNPAQQTAEMGGILRKLPS
jgi:hypothetical protein